MFIKKDIVSHYYNKVYMKKYNLFKIKKNIRHIYKHSLQLMFLYVYIYFYIY